MKMNNVWTTVPGILLVVGAALSAVAKLMTGETPDMQELATAIAGAGFLKASDGGL